MTRCFYTGNYADPVILVANRSQIEAGRGPPDCACRRLQPAHGHECHARVDLAVPAPINDPRLVTVRRQLVRRRPGQQNWLPNLSDSYSLVRGTEQIGQYGICVSRDAVLVDMRPAGLWQTKQRAKRGTHSSTT
jgi:hypothetical protein